MPLVWCCCLVWPLGSETGGFYSWFCQHQLGFSSSITGESYSVIPKSLVCIFTDFWCWLMVTWHTYIHLSLYFIALISFLWHFYKVFSFLIIVYVFGRILPESARWLLTQGKQDRAKKEILNAARINGRKVPGDLLDKVTFFSLPSFTMSKRRIKGIAYPKMKICRHFTYHLLTNGYSAVNGCHQSLIF